MVLESILTSVTNTGKSLSEALILGSTNPKYDKRLFIELGLDRTGHMSFLTGQDRTTKFAGQVLPDRTESGLIFLNILPTTYGLSILLR